MAGKGDKVGLELLRTLFDSDDVGVELAVKGLFRYEGFRYVVEFLTAEIAARPLKELEAFVLQLCLLASRGTVEVGDMLAARCADSLYFTVLVYFNLMAAFEDAVNEGDKVTEKTCQASKELCVESAVSGTPRTLKRQELITKRNPYIDSESKRRTSIMGKDRQRTLDLGSYRAALRRNHGSFPDFKVLKFQSLDGSDREVSSSETGASNNESTEMSEQQDGLIDLRREYFESVIHTMQTLVNASTSLRSVEIEERPHSLQKILEDLNLFLLSRMMNSEKQRLLRNQDVVSLTWNDLEKSVHLPITFPSGKALRMIRILSHSTELLISRERVPYMIYIEVLESTLPSCYDKNLFQEASVTNMTSEVPEVQMDLSQFLETDVRTENQERADTLSVDAKTEELQDDIRLPESDSENAEEEAEQAGPLSPTGDELSLLVFGATWEERRTEMAQKSPFRSFPGHSIVRLITKSGDDLRQELFATQFIRKLREVFVEEGLGNMGLTDYNIICVNSEAGFIEVIPDCVSIHHLKKRTPDFTNLLNFFIRMYGPPDSKRFLEAQNKFVESLVGYSLACYFGNITDRHNGNIMITRDGSLIHIDFGYMLAYSPGAIKFEQAPFKFPTEYLQIIGGKESKVYRRLEERFVAGFFAARKHLKKISSFVEMMEGSSMPCMDVAENENVVESLQARFFPDVSDEECRKEIIELIDISCENWTTAQYDHYQFITNGYL